MKSFRRIGGILLAMIVLLSIILGAWEVYRQSTVELVTAQVLAENNKAKKAAVREIDPKEIEARYQNLEQFRAMLESVREQVHAIDERDKTLEHVEVQVAKEIDPKGHEAAAERHTERIWREGDKKYRQTIEYLDLVKGKPKKGAVTRPRVDTGKINEVFPFQLPAAEDDYRYQFAGVEQINNRWTIKINFEPSNGPAGRFRGETWIDPTTFTPVRLFVSLAEKKPFLDQFSMLIDYGTVETGQVQVVSTVIDGSGGFAMVQKHIRSEIAFNNYQSLANAKKSSEPTNDRTPVAVPER